MPDPAKRRPPWILLVALCVAIWAMWPGDSEPEGGGERNGLAESIGSPSTGSSPLQSPVVHTIGRAPANALPGSDSPEGVPIPGDIQVQVVDEQGQPVPDIPVHLVRGTALRKSKFQTKAEGVSDASGLATLVDSAGIVDSIFGAGPRPPYWEPQGFRLGVRAGLPFDLPFGAEPDHGTVWLTGKPTAPIPLTIPPIGWVEVRSTAHLDDQGQEVWPTWVLVRRTEERHRGGWRMGHAVESPDQPLLLGPFGLHWGISVKLSRRNRMGSLGYLELAGPTEPGEVLKVDMDLEGTQFIEGVALNASGQPFANRKLNITLCDWDREEGANAYPTTDGEGRWSFEVAPEVEGTRLKVWLDRDPREFRGELPVIQRPDGAGRHNVGSVVLHPGKGIERILASGRVTDESGRPVRRANVSVYELLLEDGREVRAQRPLDSMRTKGDGLFELSTYDGVPSGRVRVFAGCTGFLTPPQQDVPEGSRGLQFGLVRGGSVGASFRIEHGIPKDQIVIRLKGEDHSRVLSLIEFGWESSSRFPSLKQGDYHTWVEIRSTDWLLFESPVHVESGQDVGLGEIDLREKTQLLKLHLSDAAGQNVSKQYFSLLDAQGQGYSNGLRTNDEGNIWCVIPRNPGPLRLGNGHYGEVLIQPEPGTIEVVFSK
ncbi:MAG: hypothetical protein P1V35_12620 [Planctomycetota bacterium]|nr:hypothetical protein [Planctomycetota bacterium]